MSSKIEFRLLTRALSVVSPVFLLSFALPCAVQAWQQSGEKITLSAEFSMFEGSDNGEIRVTARLVPEWYIYSVGQKRPAMATTFRLSEAEDYRLSGKWSADSSPEVKHDDLMGVNLEKHFGEVTWSAPITLSKGVDPKKLEIEINVSGQYCNEACLRLNEDLTAEFDAFMTAPTAKYRAENSHVEWSGSVSSASCKPGGKLTIEIEGAPDEGWHLYPYAEQPSSKAGVSTLIYFRLADGIKVNTPKPDNEPSEEEVFGETMLIHHGSTTWSVNMELPADMPGGDYQLVGFVGYQVCNDVTCDPPQSAKFMFSINVETEAEVKPASLMFVEGPGYNDIGKAIKNLLSKPKVEKNN